MGDVVNLRQARKKKARSEKTVQAEQNRTKFGLTKNQRRNDARDQDRETRTLDGHKIDNDEN